MALRTISTILRAGLEPPALWLGIAGLVVVFAVLNIPLLAGFASSWYIPAMISLTSWLGMAATQIDPKVYKRLLSYNAVAGDPYFTRALERRDALAGHIDRLPIDSVQAEVKAMVNSIDKDLLPELAARLQRHNTLIQALEDMEKGRGPLVNASPKNVGALQNLAEEQRTALNGLITRLSDMNANLIGLSHEVEEGQVAEETETWAKELEEYWKATAEVFRSGSLEQKL